jgi:hypothetical protein
MSADDQAERHEEALRRTSPTRELPQDFDSWHTSDNTGGSRAADTWSSGGAMPGVITPDLQGPTKALQYPDTAGSGFAEGNNNAEDIFRNPHGGRR